MHKNFFRKKSYRSLKLTSLRFLWQLCRPNWSIIWGTVNLWSMFENRQIAVIEGKCRRFRNSSECLKTHFAANNWPIWTQRCQKKRKDVDYKLIYISLQKYFVAHERSTVKSSFITYGCYGPDVLFWTVLYHSFLFFKSILQIWCEVFLF